MNTIKLQLYIQLNFVMSKWSEPRKILRHRNGSRYPIGHYEGKHFGEISVLKKNAYLQASILPLLISFIGEYKIIRYNT